MSKTFKLNSVFKKLKKRINSMSQQKLNRQNNQDTPHRFERYGTVSDWVGTIINAILGLFTIFLFFQTKTATKAAVNSARYAESAVAEQIKNDSVARVNDSIRSISDSIELVKRNVHDSISLDAQLKMIRESQNEFLATNKPFLEFRDFKLEDFEKEKNPKITYVTDNLGRYPAKLIEGRYGFFWDRTVPKMPFYKLDSMDIKKGIATTYLINGTPKYATFTSDVKVRDIQEKYAKSNLLHPFFFGEIIYLNLLNNQKMIYRFNVKFDLTKPGTYDYLYNENLPLN